MAKKKTANRRRLDSLILVLLLTAILLVMSTYAWFTANRTVNIDKLNVKIQTSSGLQISADANEWKSSIDLTDLIKATGKTGNQFPAYFEPVSTDGTANGRGGLNMYLGNVIADLDNGGFTLTTTKVDEKEGPTGSYYAAFDIFVKKSGGPSATFFVNCDATETDETFKTKVSTESGIANATRVALIKGKNDPKNTEQEELLKLDTASSKILIMEPNANRHSASAISNANTYLASNPNYLGGVSSIGSTTPVSLPYNGVATGFTDPIALPNCTAAISGDKFSLMDNINYLTAGNTKGVSLKFAGDGENALLAGVTRYRIYLWVEGQDIDCEDKASGTYLQFNLTLSLDQDNMGFDSTKLPKVTGDGSQTAMGDPVTTP